MSQADLPTVDAVLGSDGLIARGLPTYEHREPQIEMARAVDRAFEQSRHLIVEAGTGSASRSPISCLQSFRPSGLTVASSSVRTRSHCRSS